MDTVPQPASTILARGKGGEPSFCLRGSRVGAREGTAPPWRDRTAAPPAPCAKRDAVTDGRRFPPRPTWRRWLPVTCPWGGAAVA